MSTISKRKDNGRNFKSMGNHEKFLNRITKTLYYGRLPKTERLSLPVSEMASELFSETHQKHQTLQRLYCEDAAFISKSTGVSPCSFVLSLLYLERLKSCNPEYLQNIAPSKLFLISLMVSSKFLYDDGEMDEIFTEDWAKAGDISVTELCQLEKGFLDAIDWHVFVHETLFWNRLEKLETELALREGIKRGWFTYTELDTLINIYGIADLLNAILKFSAVIAATYTVGVLTLVSSVFLTSQVPGTSLYTKPKIENQKRITQETYEIPVLNAIDVLQTGFILASINDTNVMSWDWWNNPIMNWLTETSEVKTYEFNLPYNEKNFVYHKFTDMTIAIQKKLELEDNIHKATKLRIQDQLERSWHQEWTDTIFTTIRPLLYTISVF